MLRGRGHVVLHPPSGGESPYRPRSPVAAAFAARPIATLNTDEVPMPDLQAFFVSVDTSIDETGFALSSAPAGKRYRLSSGAPVAALITPQLVYLYLKKADGSNGGVATR